MVTVAVVESFATFVLSFLIGFGAVRVLLPILRHRAPDVPNERSSHTVAVPRAGGLGVAVGVAAGYVVWALLSPGENWPPLGLLVAQLGFGTLGAIDDFSEIRIRTRLIVQLCLGLVCVVIVTGLGATGIQWIALIATAIFIAGFVNAFNFMDGINGISGVTAIVAGFWFAWLGTVVPETYLTPAGLSLAGASFGFLWWNRNGIIFLGDVGSYLLGASLAIMTIMAWRGGIEATLLLAPIALYVLDTTGAVLHRASRGRKIGAAHRDHLYQQLADAKVPQLLVASWIGALTGTMAIGSWVLRSSPVATLILIAMLCAVYAVSSKVLLRRRIGASHESA